VLKRSVALERTTNKACERSAVAPAVSAITYQHELETPAIPLGGHVDQVFRPFKIVFGGMALYDSDFPNVAVDGQAAVPRMWI
jgi:hypothetical protein